MTGSNRVLPLAAMGFCGLGLLGLWLPIVHVLGGTRPALMDLPVLGTAMAVLFVLIALLPAADAAFGRVRLTPLLLLPAAAGTTFLLVVAWGTATAWDVSDVLTQLLPGIDAILDIGAGGYLLVLADFGILVVSVLSLLALRSGRRPPAPLPRPTRPPSPPVDEDL